MVESVIGIVVICVLIFLLTALFGAPYVPTQRKQIESAFSKLRPFKKNDVLVDLGSGDGVDDLYKAFERAGVPLTEDESDERRFSAGIRHRRIDSWSAADRRPRATRTVIQAGSVLRVRPTDAGSSPEETMRMLARLSVTGIGELTAQGFGRFVVDHSLLCEEEFRLTPVSHEDFIAEGCAAVKPEGE